MLMSLTQRVNQTQLQEKDPDAENLLGRELGANPDALYILAQTVLVQDLALQQAKAQVMQLQQQVQQAQQQPAHSTSFLGGLFGRHDSQPQVAQPAQQMQPGQAPPYQPVPNYQQPQYQQPGQPQYYPPPPPQPQYVAAAPYGGAVPVGQPSFMQGAMQTAAGVAAGALAFEGVESILHGFGHGGGFGGSGFGGMGMGGGFERPVEETVVNNYYDAPGAGGAGMMSGNEPHFHESADAGGGAHFSDAGYNTLGDDNAGQGGYDQSMADDSAADDNSVADAQIDDGGGGFDDGGGGFDNSGGDMS
jgi:hypothetical protein